MLGLCWQEYSRQHSPCDEARAPPGPVNGDSAGSAASRGRFEVCMNGYLAVRYRVGPTARQWDVGGAAGIGT